MSLQIRYNRVTTLAGVQPDTITARMGVSFTMAAEEGSVGMSEIVVDDTTSVLDYVGLRRVYAYETTAPAHNQMIFNGYLQGRTVTRRSEGQDSDEPVTALDRRWTLTASDSNSLMSRRLITGSDGNRPAETDIARIQWLLDSNDKYLSNPRDTWTNPSPYIDTAGPISMDAADLRGQTAFDVMNDCAQRSGKNWFARYYETNDTVPPTNGGSMALWYAFDYGTSDTSTLRLTNIKADIDNIVTFAVHPDMVLTRDPTRTYSGVYLTYDGGTTYQQSTNVSNLFQQRDAAVNNPNIKTAAKATALATRYLADAATEEDRINCRFVVAKQYVNLLREGQRFQGKFSHLPGYASDYNYMRCLRRTVTQINDEFYEIAIEVSATACVPADWAPTMAAVTVTSKTAQTGSAVKTIATIAHATNVHTFMGVLCANDDGWSAGVVPAGWTKNTDLNSSGTDTGPFGPKHPHVVIANGAPETDIVAQVTCTHANTWGGVAFGIPNAVLVQQMDTQLIGYWPTFPSAVTAGNLLVAIMARRNPGVDTYLKVDTIGGRSFTFNTLGLITDGSEQTDELFAGWITAVGDEQTLYSDHNGFIAVFEIRSC